MPHLYKLGANEVIPEEFETSVEIFTRVLNKYLIPRDEINRFIAEARGGDYEMFRSPSREATTFSDLNSHMSDVEVCSIRLEGGSPFAGKSLAQTQLRKKHGVTLLAIRRGVEVLSNPDGETVLLAGDLLIVMGTPGNVARMAEAARQPMIETKKRKPTAL
jgi:CPA2 family monovalent cation:H+ antiporter-2